MLRHKLIDRVCCVILALTLLVSALFVGAAATGKITEDTTIGYETRLFDQSRVHTIDIVMDNWEDFLRACTSEEYYTCTLVIDGEAYRNVAIRGKGNTSLSSVATYGNNRYSFKVEFDHYQTGLTYHGLDKLSLNNLIQDNTYMKDYLAYTLMNRMGVAAPLCSFVQINVNGEPWGLYLAVEGVEDSFLQRNYGKAHGELYKPDSLSFGGGRGNGRDFDMGEMADAFGFSFGGNGDDSAAMPSAPEGFSFPADGLDFSGSFGGQAPTATSDPTTAPTATSAPTTAPAADNGFGGSGGGNAAMPGAPEGFTIPADGMDFSGSFGGQAPTATSDPTTAPTATPVPTTAPAADNGFGGSSGGNAAMPGAPEGFTIPADGMDFSGSFSGQVPTATSAPTTAPTTDSGFGGSAGGAAFGGTPDGFTAGGTMPQMPADGTMPGGFDPNQFPGSSDASAATPTPEPTATAAPEASAAPVQPRGDRGETPSFPGGAGADFGDFGGFGGFGGFGSNPDVKLQYVDDDPASYSNIFSNAKTDITEADQARLIASLKALGEGDVSVVDTDAVIRYMVVHNYLCNDDSYTGMMVHNYYLYEENGVLSMIPWDYNLAYGGFSGGSNGTSTVNTDISRLVSMGTDSDRPMAGWITSSEEYMAQYLDVYQQFITDVFDSGWFEAEIDRVQAMIDPYVQQDPTAFCTYEEFLAGAETLREFCIRRARSVTNQLNGDAARVDASDLNLSLMGTMNGMGGGMGGFDMGGMGGDSREDRNAPAGNESSGNGAQPTDGFAGFDPAQGMPSQMPVNDAAGAMPQMSGDMFAPFGGQASAPATEESAAAAVPEDNAAQPTDDAPRGRPGSGGGFSMNGVTPQSSSNGWLWLGTCALLLAAALILARCWRTNR